MDGQIIASIVAVLGSLGGALIGALIQREGKKLAALERRIERYRLEIKLDKLKRILQPRG